MKKIIAHWRVWLTLIITVAILLIMWSCYFFNINLPAQITPTATSTIISISEVKEEVVVNPVPVSDYLSNPGMGWQNDSSEGASSGYFPETVIYSSREKIAWNSLNPQEGVYDWSAIDEQLEYAIARGKQFSFRVYTVRGESFGGNQIPDWVLNKGALVFPSGEPDYSNCVYQQEWGRFVSALIAKYDGNPAIAFIDISGYGNFNEWNWNDQTEWDSLWESSYNDGTATPASMRTLDSQTRRRLADIFIGGNIQSHQCRASDGSKQTVSYSYTGAQSTQLVMPYAGISQSTQYVFLRRKDVGFRYDCLGRSDSLPMDLLGQIWKQAPIIYELCSSENVDMRTALDTVKSTHPILIHNNNFEQNLIDLQALVLPVGYRFVLNRASLDPSVQAGNTLPLSMVWQNLGEAPAYVKMGQRFQLRFYLVDSSGNALELNNSKDEDISQWFPADKSLSPTAPEYHVDPILPIPANMPAGEYALEFSILDLRTSLPIQIAIEGMNQDGRYFLHKIQVISSQ